MRYYKVVFGGGRVGDEGAYTSLVGFVVERKREIRACFQLVSTFRLQDFGASRGDKVSAYEDAECHVAFT